MFNFLTHILLIELTKANVSRWDEDQKGISTQAIWWVQTYHDSVKELNEAIKTYKKDNGIEMNITPEMLSELDSGLR